MRNILVVDTDVVMRNTLSRLMKGAAGVITILEAESAEAALGIVSRVKIDMIIAGFRIAESDSLRLIAHLQKHNPEIRLIVMSEVSSDTLQAQIEQLSVDSVMEEPIDSAKLAEMIFRDLEIDYGGKIRGVSLSSFLQMMELEGKTCRLNIRKNHKTGDLYFLEGDLWAAETGEIAGKDAALAIIKWDDTIIDIDYTPFNREREISLPLMSVLLESRRIEDENDTGPVDKRQNERFACAVDVEYDIEDWSYGGRIRDISLGGVYIETKQPASLDQEIMLTLNTPNMERHCTITGKIVRRDPKGIGVRFKALSLLQMRVVNSLISAN